ADGRRITGEVTILNISQASGNPAECARLRLCPDGLVWRIRQVRQHGGKPFMVEDIAMPALLFPELGERADLTRGIAGLAQHYGILLGKGDERLSMGSASPSVAEALNLRPGAPILMLDRLLHALNGQAVKWRVGAGHFANKYYMAEIH